VGKTVLKEGRCIRSEMTVLDVVSRYRKTEEVFKQYDKQAGECICCHALFKTLQDVAKKYGFSLVKLLADLEAAASKSAGSCMSFPLLEGGCMPGFDSRLKELYLNKPEWVINFPKWFLSSQKINELRSMPRMAIVEVAGRDSVAAAVKGVEKEDFTDLIPTYAFTGTEHGPWSSVVKAVGLLSRRLPEVRVHKLLVIGSCEFWQALNGRFISDLITRYGFYTPCPGCHFYLHSVRIPLALILGKVPIISGEREQHDGAVKINQISEALTIYQNLSEDFGVRLLFPLRHIAKGDRIKDILGFEWQEGKNQLNCVLSENYR